MGPGTVTLTTSQTRTRRARTIFPTTCDPESTTNRRRAVSRSRSPRRSRDCGPGRRRNRGVMLDSRLLRSEPEAVARNLARRGVVLDLAQFQALEERRKAAQAAADQVRAGR